MALIYSAHGRSEAPIVVRRPRKRVRGSDVAAFGGIAMMLLALTSAIAGFVFFSMH